MVIITTAPSVIYEVVRTDGEVLYVDSPSQMPEVSDIEEVREPIVEVSLLMPQDYVGPVMTLCNARRGIQKNMTYLGKQVSLVFEIPLAEVVLRSEERRVGKEWRWRRESKGVGGEDMNAEELATPHETQT